MITFPDDASAEDMVRHVVKTYLESCRQNPDWMRLDGEEYLEKGIAELQFRLEQVRRVKRDEEARLKKLQEWLDSQDRR